MRPFAGLLIIVCLLLTFIPLNNEIAGLSTSYSGALQIIFGVAWVGGMIVTGIYSLKEAY
jgi:hypothetical protein